MNLLTRQPPERLEIGDYYVGINTDFRLMVEFELLLTEESESEDFEKRFINLLNRLIPDLEYCNTVTQDELTSAIMQYYSCGKDYSVDAEAEDGSTNSEPPVERIYSFSYDDEYIYAAFMEAYGIDLTKAEMHWWKFRALFNSLPQSCMFSRILGYRGIEITSDMSSSQKDFYRKMQRKFALPLPRAEQEKMDAITAALMGGGNLSEVL